MVRVEMSAVYPVSIEDMWKIIAMHRDHLLEIHPRVKSRSIITDKDNERTELREVEILGQRLQTTLKYVFRQPESFDVEVLEGQYYAFAKSSRWTNRYESMHGRTRVTTIGEFIVSGVPDEQAMQIVEEWGESLDQEDFDFKKKLSESK